ncbi:MAG TPA: polysaccharide deacetylase family protein [Paenibacillus sp.]|jgi:peptidoglycan/xylan/chitin deacetylase (PgdA/CDA1 family)
MSKAYLTIDDGPTKITPQIIDYLSSKSIIPNMFFTGEQIEGCFEEGVYALKKGAIVGNHSYNHPSFNELTFDESIIEIEKQEKILEELYKMAGVERKYKVFRFPYGNKGDQNKEAIQNYLLKNQFCRIDDSEIDFEWYKLHKLNEDIDVFWTFDFLEYQLKDHNGLTFDHILHRIHDKEPATGGFLLDESAHHIVLIH